jgi:hypothetical protein
VTGRVKEITGAGQHYALVCVGDKQVIFGRVKALRIGGMWPELRRRTTSSSCSVTAVLSEEFKAAMP